MTELDFDELDKAVNSLMAENGPEDAPISEPVVPVTPNTPATPSAPVSAPSPAIRRRGQFMDVIHPSGSMRPMQPAASRQGLGVTPPTMQAAATPDNTPMTESAFPAPATDTTPDFTERQNPATVETPSQVWPDPIDTMTPPDTTEERTDSTGDTQELQAETPSVEPDMDLGDTEDPLTSPFLADAKVEKRPLGNGLPSSEMSAESIVLEQSLAAETDVNAPSSEQVSTEGAGHYDETTSEPIVLPDELHQDVVAVESNEVAHEDLSLEVSATEAPALATDIAAEAVPVTAAMTQQYQEQPSTGDQTNGAIYDTNTYHQPLEAHSAKKKSAILTWILWIIVLLIIGATAGAAWFYFTTQ